MSVNTNTSTTTSDPSNIGSIADVIETKLDQLIQSVKEIKEQMHDNSIDIANLKLQLNTLQNKTETQDEKINELKKHNETNKNLILGTIMAVAGSLIVAIIKVVATVM